MDDTTRPPARFVGERALPRPPVLPPPRIDVIRRERHEVNEGGVAVIEEPGNRTILRDAGIIRHVESDRIRRLYGPAILRKRGDFDDVVVRRADGAEIDTPNSCSSSGANPTR